MRRVVATAGFVLLCCFLALTLTAAVTAQEEGDGDSGEPPAFGNATKGNLTTIELTITDDTDVDEGSITAGDFELEPGDVRDVDVNESGSDAHVEIFLTNVVESDTVNVSLAEGGSIDDSADNTLTTAEATAAGMDAYSPQLQDLTITRLNESAVDVEVVSSEALSELYVGVGGPGGRTLTIDNFTARDTRATFEYPYNATVTFDSDGEYDVLVGTLTDENAVSSRYNVERTVLVDRTAPSASIDGPASADVGEEATFDGTGSTDEFGVNGYEWAVDGNETATGETLEHTFETPGYHEVTLTATDRRNNTDDTSMLVLVESTTTRENVTVDANGSSVASATVGPNRTTGRVLIDRDGGLVTTAGVRIDSLTVDVPVGEGADLEFTATENASASFEAVDTTALAGLEVTHERSLSSATFRFAVNRTRLDAAGLSPRNVTLYRHADGWRSVYTTRIDESDGWVIYEATAAGLSEFVVGASGGDVASNDADGETEDTGAENGTDATNGTEGTGPEAGTVTGSASILVTNSTLLTGAVDAGDRVLVRATARNAGNATGTFEMGLVVNNSHVTTTPVTVPPGENRSVTFAERVETGGTVVVNGTIAGELSVEGGQAATAAESGGGGLPIPNPLSLWPGGLVGRVLGAVFWFLAVSFTVLKALAIYLGY